jgi:hypothetical protein
VLLGALCGFEENKEESWRLWVEGGEGTPCMVANLPSSPRARPGAVFYSISPLCFCFRPPGFEWISEEALGQIVAWGISEVDDMVASVPISSSKEIYLCIWINVTRNNC